MFEAKRKWIEKTYNALNVDAQQLVIECTDLLILPESNINNVVNLLMKFSDENNLMHWEINEVRELISVKTALSNNGTNTKLNEMGIYPMIVDYRNMRKGLK